MSSIIYSEPELVIALNRKIIFVNPNDLQIFKEIVIPQDLKQHLQKSDQGDKAGGVKLNEEEEAPQKSQSPNTAEPQVQLVAISPNRSLIAVTTSGQKALLLYQAIRLEHAKLLTVRALARTSSALVFSEDSKKLIVADKSGDCYEYQCSNDKLQEPGRLLFGHLSVLYDVIWTPDTEYIVSCDRDDKIRITNYPETYDIHGYCLGHKEFVSGIALLRDSILVSVSGDKTLRLWNYLDGQEIQCVQLPAPGIRLVVRPNTDKDDRYQCAVLLYQNGSESVYLYEIVKSSPTSQWVVQKDPSIYEAEIEIHNLCFAGPRLYLLGCEHERLKIRTFSLDNASLDATPANWQNMIEEQFKDDLWMPENVASWFKKRYDNVSDYLDRKKRRIEGKK